MTNKDLDELTRLTEEFGGYEELESMKLYKLDNEYENYRRGIIERHICRDGRFLQDVLLDKETKEVIYVEEDGQKKVLGGGDNPFLYGGLMMATFSMEAMSQGRQSSLKYATRLLTYFVNQDIEEFRRKKNWWRDYKSLSKDELSGLILGLHFYLEATKFNTEYLHWYFIALAYLKRIAVFLTEKKFKPAGSWLFRYPFCQVFKHHLGEAFGITNWYDKWLFYFTMGKLPLVYQLASLFKKKRNFYNIAMYTHCLWMIYLTPCNDFSELSAYSKLYKFFCTKGWKPYQGQETGNNYIELTNDVMTGSGFGKELTSYKWNKELPYCEIEGPENDFIGECFTWEHPNSGNHNLEYDWGKVLWRLGPSNRQQLDDMNKEFIVESCGLGLLFIRALATYEGLCNPLKLENNDNFKMLDLDGPI